MTLIFEVERLSRLDDSSIHMILKAKEKLLKADLDIQMTLLAPF